MAYRDKLLTIISAKEYLPGIAGIFLLLLPASLLTRSHGIEVQDHKLSSGLKVPACLVPKYVGDGAEQDVKCMKPEATLLKNSSNYNSLYMKNLIKVPKVDDILKCYNFISEL